MTVDNAIPENPQSTLPSGAKSGKGTMPSLQNLLPSTSPGRLYPWLGPPTQNLLQQLSFEAASPEASTQHYWVLCQGRESAAAAPTVQAVTPPPKRVLDQSPKGEDDLDLTGSPLKCDFNMDEDFDTSLGGLGRRIRPVKKGDNWIPLPTMQARSCLSRFNLVDKSALFADSRNICWAVCDASDEGTIFIGSERTLSELVLHTVTASGPFTAKDEALKMDTLLREHAKIEARGKAVTNSITCRSWYNLSAACPDDDDDDDHPTLCNATSLEDSDSGPMSSLSVQLNWSQRPRSLLEKPSVDAKTTLQAKVIPGDEKMSTASLWRELKSLEGFLAGLEGGPVAFTERGEEETTLQENLLALLEHVRDAGPRNNAQAKVAEQTVNQNDSNEDPSKNFLTGSSRQDVDFLDMLWTVMHRVESYAELTACLQNILVQIQQEDLRPFIYANSTSKIARIIGDIVRGKINTVPELSGRQPLDILVELGVEKLKRDYAHHFMAHYLATKDDLAPFLAPTTSPTLAFKQLLRLHLVADLSLLVQTYLSPNHDCLRAIVHSAMADLERDEGEASGIGGCGVPREFSFNIQTVHVRHKLEKLSPSVWQCRVLSSSSAYDGETVAHLTNEAPSPLVESVDKEYFGGDETDATVAGSLKPDVLYYYTVKKTIRRRGKRS